MILGISSAHFGTLTQCSVDPRCASSAYLKTSRNTLKNVQSLKESHLTSRKWMFFEFRPISMNFQLTVPVPVPPKYNLVVPVPTYLRNKTPWHSWLLHCYTVTLWHCYTVPGRKSPWCPLSAVCSPKEHRIFSPPLVLVWQTASIGSSHMLWLFVCSTGHFMFVCLLSWTF